MKYFAALLLNKHMRVAAMGGIWFQGPLFGRYNSWDVVRLRSAPGLGAHKANASQIVNTQQDTTTSTSE
jgi:hypothetical protein